MKKAMFNKFTSFIQQAVDTFVPNVAPQEEFVYHWKSITSYFVDNKDGNVRIEETALPEHLMSMLHIIQEEESDLGDAGTTGPSLEYLLQHRLLETLYTLGRTDYPPGMKQIVLSFFTKLLSRISHPLLPHINVHRAVQRLVKACGEIKAGPAEKEEIEFLCTVCAKIKTDPYLVNFFIENPKPTPGLSQVKNARPPQTFCLVDALLALSYSEDARVSVKACEGLMLCASLPEQSAATALIHQTRFCQSIAGILTQLYEKLPSLVTPDNVDGVEAKWGFDDIIGRSDKQGFTGKLQVISFLSWLDYCDQLIAVANPQVGEALASEIHRCFLTGRLFPNLMQPSESGAIVATTYLTRCLRTVCSPALLREFCFFLLGTDRKLEPKDYAGHHLNKRLLERCNHLSEEVCIATLKLFDTLLQKEDEHIFHCLLNRNLLGRSYLKGKSSPSVMPEVKSALVDSNERLENVGKTDKSPMPSETPDIASDLQYKAKDPVTSDETQQPFSGGSDEISLEQTAEGIETSQSKPLESNQVETNTTTAVDQSAVGDSLNGATFTDNQKKDASLKSDPLGLGEDDSVVKSSNTAMYSQSSAPGQSSSTTCSPGKSDSSTSSYISSSLSSGYSSPKIGRPEVYKVVNCFLGLLPDEVKSSYQTADSGYDMYLRDANRQETVSKEWAWPTRPVSLAEYEMQVFYEGSFLHMLLDKLLHLLDQSYSVNLLLTALIAKVALIPHPNLHEYLLDPFLPTVEGTRTLYSVLVKVANEIKHHQKSDSTFSQKLLLARKQLLGIVPTIHRFEDQSRMEAIIVLEEFCKELSAITFVKHHAAVTRI